MTVKREGVAVVDEDATAVAERVGRTIKALRAMKGMAQAELAKRIGFTPTGVWKVEAGRTDAPLSTLVKIAHALDTPLERVVGGFDSGPALSGIYEGLGLRGLAAHEREMRELLLRAMSQSRESEHPEAVGPEDPIALGT